MEEAEKRRLEQRNQRIIDAVIRKSEKECPGSVALIGIGGSFCSGDIHEKSDLDLLIVINDDAGWKIASCFILNGVAHDIYCTPWSRLEEMAEYRDPYIVKLIDLKIVYCACGQALRRYRQLEEKVQEKLDAPFAPEDLQKTEKYIDDAAKAYAAVMTAGNAGACRYASSALLLNMEYAVYMLNKTYVKRGVRRIPEEISGMKRLPDRFMEYYRAVAEARTVPEIRQSSTLLYGNMREYFERFKNEQEAPKKELTAKELDGSYEEIYSNWRNKMHLAAENGNTYLALMTAASCQNFYDERYAAFQMGQIDLMSDFRPDDLTHSAKAFDRAMEKYRREYEKIGKPVREYATIGEFEKDYLG